MLLFEILRRSDTPFIKVLDKPYMVKYRAVINGKDVDIEFKQSYPYSKAAKDYYGPLTHEYDKVYAVKGGSYKVVFDVDGEVNQTGGGDEYKISSVVLSVVKTFITTHKVIELVFSASATEPKRVRLYQYVSKILPQKLGFKVAEINNGANTMFSWVSESIGH